MMRSPSGPFHFLWLSDALLVTLEECRAYTAEMQAKMRLKDWIVAVEWMDDKEAEDNYGCCSWATCEKTATIELRRNMESDLTKHTIRHELCHILLEGHGKVKYHGGHYEFGIDWLAKLIG